MQLRRNLLASLLLGAVLSQAWPLEVSEGQLKLVLHQGSGRFSLYSNGVALFVDQDPRTSGLALYLDGKVYRLGAGGEFKQSAEKVPGGARFIWTSKRATVTAIFAFQGADAMSLSLTVRNNNAEGELSAGVRLLLDTYLGETGFPHFLIEGVGEVNGEHSFNLADMPAYWLSRSSRETQTPGLQMPLRGPQVTAPDRLVVANWKRLDESSWLYESSPARTFSELPYSINDSAACLYFGPAPLPAGASRSFLMLFSASREPPPAGQQAGPSPAPAGEAAQTAAQVQPAAAQQGVPEQVAAAPQVPEEPPASPGAEAQEAARLKLNIQGDLRVVDDLLQQLAVKLEAKTALSAEELGLMEQIITDLKKRLESYGE